MIFFQFLFKVCIIFATVEKFNGNPVDPIKCSYYSPRCDTAWNIYDNICELTKALSDNPSVQSDDCDDSVDCGRSCNKNSSPVCDNKGMIFDNECIFQTAKTSVCIHPSRKLVPCPD